MKYLYKQTGIVVESDDVLDSTMFKPIIEEKTEDLIEDSETELQKLKIQKNLWKNSKNRQKTQRFQI